MDNRSISTAARIIAGDALAAALVFRLQSLWAPLNGFFGHSFWYLFLAFVTFSAVYRLRDASKTTLGVIAVYAGGTLMLYVLNRLLVDRTAGLFELFWFASLFAAVEGAARLKGRRAAISR
jgi:NADH:ubiquinone oxidoreductase subunit 6 (subunit J)